jgi:CubicO group peptidase (beta-lactamase class C family)
MSFWRREPEVDPASVGVDPAVLDRIAEDFESVLSEQRLLHGAQLAMHRRGACVLDLGAGVARVRTGVPVTPETLFVMFSSTKGLAGLAMLMLHERGAFEYDDPVVKYWPTFARVVPEKAAMTIHHVMTHRGGIPLGPRGLGPDQWIDRDALRDAMEEVQLRFAPGERNAYHPMNFGHLVNELISRIDGRDCGQFLRDEVFAPLGIDDLFVGLPDDPALEARVAWCYGDLPILSPARKAKTEETGKTEPAQTPVAKEKGPELPPRYADTPELANAFNRPEIHRAVLPGAGGIGTARSLSSVFSVLAMGGSLGDVHLVSAEGLREVTRPSNRSGDKDGTLGFPMRWATGFHVGGHGRGSTLATFGHGGAGGQIVFADPDRELSFGFLCNGELAPDFIQWRFGLQSAAFEACKS